MTKRIVSLVLVLATLFGICMSTVSCTYLEGIVGEENLGDEYLDKYYPDRDTADNGGNGGNGGNNNNGGNNGGNEYVPTGEHASYAEKKEGYNLITFYWNNPMIKDMSKGRSWTCL